MAALSAAVVLAGCSAAGDDDGRSTAPVPPDRVFVTLRGGGAPDFRVQLDCAVADREACVAVLDALEDAQDERDCVPRPDGGGASVLVTGTIEGAEIRAVVPRRTSCEIRTYDRIVSGAGL